MTCRVRTSERSSVRVTGPSAWDHDWAKLPDGWSLGDVADVTVDDHDNVYVFARSEHPVMVFNAGGEFLRSWGEGLFVNPHGISHGADDHLYCTDRGDSTVRKFSKNGQLALKIDIPGKSAPGTGRPDSQSVYAHRARAEWRYLRYRRLRQCAGRSLLA